MIGWSAVVFGTCNAGRKANSTRLHLALFYSFLPALLALLIPNTTADHPITYTYRPYRSLKCGYRHTLTTVVMGRSTASCMSLDVLTGSAYTLYRETTPLGVAGSLHLIHTSGELVTLTERERGGDGPEHCCVWMHVSKVCEHCLNFRAIQTSD